MMDCIKLTDILLLNRGEAQRLTGIVDPEAAGKALLDQGPEIVLVKCGGEGCVLISGDEIHNADSYPVDVHDKTGAGDSVAGAVIYGVLNNFSLAELTVLANLTGAAKVQKLGTGHNMPMIEDIQGVMDRFQVELSKPLS
jgi:sugar/nucleoside kinase (ribokinase family)